MTKSDELLLNEACKICADSIWQIQIILNKVEDEDLAQDLNRQMGKYIRIINKANQQLENNGKKPYQNKMLDRMKKWSKIQKNTLLNASSSHIANLLIKDNTKGIAYMLKALHDYPDAACCEFAEELVEFEEKTIKQLSFYQN